MQALIMNYLNIKRSFPVSPDVLMDVCEEEREGDNISREEVRGRERIYVEKKSLGGRDICREEVSGIEREGVSVIKRER